MIGVLLENSDISIVQEFFQLFKTPWMVYQPGFAFDVVITDRQDLSGLSAPLIIIFKKPSNGPHDASCVQAWPGLAPVVLCQPDGPDFPVYTGTMALPASKNCLTVKDSGQCASRREVQAQGFILQLGFHLFDEVQFILKYGQPLAYAQVPTIDIHIDNLRKWILSAGLHLIEIPPHPQGSPFFVCLTHDVDFAGIRRHKMDLTLAGFVYRALITSSIGYARGKYAFRHLARNWLAVASLPLIFAGLKKDFWFQFKKYVELEQGHPSTFFLVPFKDTPGTTEDGAPIAGRAVKYDVADLKNEVDYLLQRGCEVSVHGLDAWHHPGSAREELEKIRSLTGQDRLGVRMHWLFNSHHTPSVLEKAGYWYDSTWGYNETPGYRAGTLQAFKPPKATTLLELPMHIMDTALFYPDRMNLSFAQGLETIKRFSDCAQTFGGALTLNWHHRSIAPERLWDGVYLDVLDALSSRSARFATAGAVVDWFKKRRSLIFEAIVDRGESITVSRCGDGKAASELNDLVLRVHTSPIQAQSLTKFLFKDYALQTRHEISLPKDRQMPVCD